MVKSHFSTASPWFPHCFHGAQTPEALAKPPRRRSHLRPTAEHCDWWLPMDASGGAGCRCYGITQGGLTYQLMKIEDLTSIFHFQNRDPARIGIWRTIVVHLTSFTRRSGFDEEKMRQCSGAAKPSMVLFHFGDDSVARQCSAVRLPEVCHTGCPAASGRGVSKYRIWFSPCEDVLELYSRLIYVEISWLYIHIRHVDLIFLRKIQEPAYSVWKTVIEAHLGHGSALLPADLTGHQWPESAGGAMWATQRSAGDLPHQVMVRWWFGTFFPLSIYWECHHPNWLIFFRGVGIPPTRWVHATKSLISPHETVDLAKTKDLTSKPHQ